MDTAWYSDWQLFVQGHALVTSTLTGFSSVTFFWGSMLFMNTVVWEARSNVREKQIACFSHGYKYQPVVILVFIVCNHYCCKSISEMNVCILTNLGFSILVLRVDILSTPLFGANGPKPRLRRTWKVMSVGCPCLGSPSASIFCIRSPAVWWFGFCWECWALVSTRGHGTTICLCWTEGRASTVSCIVCL